MTSVRTLSRKTIHYSLLVSSILLYAAEQAEAADYLASTGDVIAVSGHTVLAERGDGLLLDAQAHRSYSCEGIPSASDSAFSFSTSVAGTRAEEPASVTARATGEMNPRITGGAETEGKTRVSFVPQESDRYRIAVESAKEGGEDVRLRCVETTLFGGYNTSVNDFNFLELQNLSNAPISGVIVAIDYHGRELIDAHRFSIPAGRRKDFDLHTHVGQSSFGIIKIVHDAPSKALQGRVSFYTGNASHFILRGSVRLHQALN